jgi:uncharacterized protein YigE (DUF2233 family)
MWHFLKSIWFRRLVLAFLVLFACLWWLLNAYFNIHSNLVAVAVRSSKEALLIHTKRGEWRKPSSLTPAEVHQALILRAEEPGMRWSTLRVRRPAGTLASLAQGLLGAELNIITFAPENFEFTSSFLPKFTPTTAAERLRTEMLNFCITANFRDPAGKPLGYVWHEGRQLNPAFKEWSGCFFVKGGRPYFGPKSLLEDVPGPIEEATQGYPSVMKNHTIFPYVDLKPDTFFDGTKITYRSLAGMKKDGTIVFILSGNGGIMNVSETAEIARKLDVCHATLLDGGRALQYSLTTEDGPWHFAAANTTWNQPPFSKALAAQRSPVFIGVRRRAPSIYAP